SSIESGVRNGTDFAIENVDDDRVLLVRTAGSDPGAVTWHCAAWYFSESAGTIRHARSASDTVPVAVPGSEPLGWTLLASGIEAVETSEVFSFDGSTLTIEFQGTSESMQPVFIKSSSALRAGAQEKASCF